MPALDVVARRPRTRGECPASRPCPWVSCQHHLALHVNPRSGSIYARRPDGERDGAEWGVRVLRQRATAAAAEAFVQWVADAIELAAETCALDVAERAAFFGVEVTQIEVAELLGVSNERIKQIERGAMQCREWPED